MRNATIEEILLTSGAVQINPEHPFTYTSGIKSPIYTDCRILISSPKLRHKIVSMLCIECIEAQVIAGTATAGIPWASWVAERLGLPLVYVRSEKKQHGKGKQVEGSVQPRARVVLIEDLVSTGGNSLGSVAALRELGCRVQKVVVIFSYGLADAAFKDAGVELASLTTLPKLLGVALKIGHLTAEQVGLVEEWRVQNMREFVCSSS